MIEIISKEDNLDELMKEFLYQWNQEKDTQINADEYYAVLKFKDWLKENY